MEEKVMRKTSVDLETDIIRMGDVRLVIDVVDNAIEEGDDDKAQRAIEILEEIFSSRYDELKKYI
jgi:hydrogenase maturation factor